jgi:hypothetical protein
MDDTTNVESQGNVISMDKYVGVKEMLRKATQKNAELNVDIENLTAERDTFKQQVASLNEQYKTYVSKDEHDKIMGELNTFKSEALNTQRKTFADKYGLNVEDIKDFTEEQLKLVEIGARNRSNDSKPVDNEGDKNPKAASHTTEQPKNETPTTPVNNDANKPKGDFSGGSGSSVPLSALDACKVELEQIKSK